MGVWILLGMTFGYLLPYLTYRGVGGGFGEASLPSLLPGALVAAVLAGFPVFGAVFGLMLGVLAIGSEYGWDTLKTVLTQRSGRTRLLTAKLAAMGIGLIPFVVAMFVAGAAASYVIAVAEGAAVDWPPILDLVRGAAAGWFVFCVWGSIGVVLAVLSRGTALAIGLGVLYILLVESLVSALADQVGWLSSLVEYSIRANAYSLVTALGVPAEALADNGPGSFFGPFVEPGQAILVLGAYLGVSAVVAALVLSRRDVI
jgi:ABC-type transport system involved in multi-copper enzyme maturation permease subunit